MRLTNLLRRAFLATLLFPAALVAQPREVVGTRITLEPPAGFTPAERFPGFGQEETLASIMVTELSGPFDEVVAGLTAERLAGGGMTLRSADSLTVGGRPGRLLSITQPLDGVPFEKWVLVFGDSSETAIVTGSYPREASATLSDPVRQAVLSARRSGRPVGDPFEGIGFHIEPGSRLRIAERMGNMLALNETGRLPNDGAASPFLVVGLSISEENLADLEAFSRQRVTRIGNAMEMREVTRGGPVTIDGATAYELFADAVDTESAIPIKVYQVIVAEGNHYILFQGFVGADRAAEFIPEFQAIVRTLRRTR
jgi:hypothetical protein